MKRLVSLAAGFCALLGATGCPKPSVQDISPDLLNGTSQATPSSEGLTIALAGGSSRIYAVSLNAGVWRNDGPDQSWEQLINSPPRAYSIAIDPSKAQHLAVGEREGDLSDPAARRSGVWESFDSGDTWSYVLDPHTLGCSAQAIPAVAFNAQGTLFAATSCGVARRAKGSTQFALVLGTTGLGPITALAVSVQSTWARTGDRMLIGDITGLVWSVKAFPGGTTFTSTGELYSLAASDQFAYVSCCTVAEPPCGTSNKILIYNLGLDTWTLQPEIPDSNGKPSLGCNGTGLGGSKFIRGFLFHRGKAAEVFRLFVSAAQEIYEAKGIGSDGAAVGWDLVLGATCPGCTNHDPVHSDFWDFLLDPYSGHMWIANDGGVYERKELHPGFAWVMRNQGLHTHHIHTLTLMGHKSPAPSLVYPTSDNEGWYSTLSSSPAAWHATGNLGDANWSAGDDGNPHQAIIVRARPYASMAQDSAPFLRNTTLSNDGTFDGPEAFHFIQTALTESVPDTALDAVILTTLPLQYVEDQVTKNVPGDLGAAASAGRVVLLRKRDFETGPDINLSKGRDGASKRMCPRALFGSG